MRNTMRSNSGFTAIEIAISSFLIIVFGALIVDLTLLNFAVCTNDAACRDAARAAASTSNLAQAQLAAQAQLDIHATDGSFISQPVLGSTFVYNDYSGSPPTNTSPYVTVSTTITVRVPCPIVFFGAEFGKNGSLIFTRQYTFPIVKEKFYG